MKFKLLFGTIGFLVFSGALVLANLNTANFQETTPSITPSIRVSMPDSEMSVKSDTKDDVSEEYEDVVLIKEKIIENAKTILSDIDKFKKTQSGLKELLDNVDQNLAAAKLGKERVDNILLQPLRNDVEQGEPLPKVSQDPINPQVNIQAAANQTGLDSTELEAMLSQ